MTGKLMLVVWWEFSQGYRSKDSVPLHVASPQAAWVLILGLQEKLSPKNKIEVHDIFII